jgi:hypothetical protein
MILFAVLAWAAHMSMSIWIDVVGTERSKREAEEAVPRSEWQRLPWEAEPTAWRWLQHIDKQDTRQQETAK